MGRKQNGIKSVGQVGTASARFHPKPVHLIRGIPELGHLDSSPQAHAGKGWAVVGADSLGVKLVLHRHRYRYPVEGADVTASSNGLLGFPGGF